MCKKISFIITLLLVYPFPAYCDSGIMKINHSSETVYLAKSGLEDKDTWDIRWSSDYAIAGKTVVYSERKWDNTDSSFEGKILSIVGQYISYKDTSGGFTEGAAHPWCVTRFSTINMISGKEVKLTEIFDEMEICKALLKDEVIKKALHGKSPRNLEELLEQADGGDEFCIDKNSLGSFVFHHVKGNKVAVRMGLVHGCEARRGNFTQIGFYLEIPKNLKEPFDSAQERNLLMNQMAKLKY